MPIEEECTVDGHDQESAAFGTVAPQVPGFAELVAKTALSFLDETGGGPARTLVEQIVAGAVLVIPGTVAAAVENLDEQGRLYAPDMEGDAAARSVMEAQNEAGEGPCRDALRDNKQIVTDDLATDPRWPSFSARATELGMRAIVCTPMEADGRRLGVLSAGQSLGGLRPGRGNRDHGHGVRRARGRSPCSAPAGSRTSTGR